MEQNNELELLRDELSKVVGVANEFNVSHTKTAEYVGIGYDYGRMIRNGDRPNRDTKENRTLIQNLINAYRKQIRKKQEILASINVEIEIIE